ncbi:MAG: NAD(P)-dependent oxidoreductase [Cyclobacteriaceae bacterium]
MLKFNQISCIDGKLLNDEAISQLDQFSINKIKVHRGLPENEIESIKRIGDADCILLGFNTTLSEDVLKQCTNVKYIGLCCTLFEDEFSNVNLRAAKEQNITIKGVTDYGDVGSVEFLFSELIAYMQGTHGKQWKNETRELKDASIGILGMGRLGKKVADLALAFGMNVYYNSRTEKSGNQYSRYKYLPLRQLLQATDIISFHVPRRANVLNSEDFRYIKKDGILVNLSMGLPFAPEDLYQWLNNSQNFAIMDKVGMGNHYQELSKFENVSLTNKVTGLTKEAKNRLSEKVVANIMEFCKAATNESSIKLPSV